jgi:hypothetical protein
MEPGEMEKKNEQCGRRAEAPTAQRKVFVM